MHAYLEEFASQCAQQSPPDMDEKFVGWEGLIITLVGVGLTVALPELKEWVRLGAEASSLIRQKKLIDYATEHELDFPAAEKAAELVAERVKYNNLGMAWQSLDDLPKARDCLEKALRIFSDVYGNDHPNTQAVRDDLEQLET